MVREKREGNFEKSLISDKDFCFNSTRPSNSEDRDRSNLPHWPFQRIRDKLIPSTHIHSHVCSRAGKYALVIPALTVVSLMQRDILSACDRSSHFRTEAF